MINPNAQKVGEGYIFLAIKRMSHCENRGNKLVFITKHASLSSGKNQAYKYLKLHSFQIQRHDLWVPLRFYFQIQILFE